VIGRIVPAGDYDTSTRSFRTLTGPEYAAQKIRQRFKLFLGEWFLDQSLGVPWFTEVFVKNPNLDLIRALFRAELLKGPGIIGVSSIESSFVPATRTLSLAYVAIYETGAKLSEVVSSPVPG
jgi:hypothetical protein